MRWVAAVALVCALACPTVTVADPQPVAAVTVGCPDQQVPPGPPVEEEQADPPPAPLPWPPEPVGGPQLGACGRIGPDGGPELTAESWVLADLDTGAVLAAQAPHARHRPASTLKVLTALTAIRSLNPDQVVQGTAEDQAIEGSKAGIGPGGQYTVRQLLAGLLLNSGNDTAQALARAMGGDAAMIAKMTEIAREVGALDTRPATPSGLDGPGMASSAYDLALLFRVAMREPLFAETIRLRSIPFPGYADHPGFVLYNSSKLLANYEAAIGGKTGFTQAARHTLVAAAERDGRRLVIALMRGEQSPVPMWKQGMRLLEWGFELPATTPAVGHLVDRAPAPPEPPAPPPAADQAAAQTLAVRPVPPLLPLGLGAVALAGMVIGGLALRRRH
ncbi:MAG TPA: D-alanyl-D-alanine carboxypeptidase family protein [Pseudonocardia sp.]|uniref:D-alanyl-D-alanine carboxypeptidase family protein n=1 Tax=Pseudonocardia sp. TaxID=60912 RepID=UPI002B4B264E|nr:D-alanyl-D-alanine carboxypeptidase family protein [Pseudonocardia sp.]HLU53870.1 D-alanyl-D-alanine carboxypeptidase family protein [Pseudonocardia sp.]